MIRLFNCFCFRFFNREKQLDKEREILTGQINLLSNDVTKHSKDLVNLRREQNAQIINIQTDLQRKTEEVCLKKFEFLLFFLMLNVLFILLSNYSLDSSTVRKRRKLQENDSKSH